MLLGGGCSTAISVELLSQVDAEACGVWLTFWQVFGIAAASCAPQLATATATATTATTTGTVKARIQAIETKKQRGRTEQSPPDSTSWRLFIPRNIPLSSHLTSAGLVAGAMVMSNGALAFNLPLPLHILLKSASLPASAAASYWRGLWIPDRFSVAAISTVTVGVLVATVAGISPAAAAAAAAAGGGRSGGGKSPLLGGLLAGASVVTAAVLGAYQDSVSKKYGKHWKEMLFYSHALALPVFVIFQKNLWKVFQRWTQVKRKNFKLWGLLLLNLLCAHTATMGIYRVTNETSSLSCTMGITVRKLLSLFLSLFCLQKKGTFGRSQWFGTVGVFGGSFMWTLLKFLRRNKKKEEKEEKEEKDEKRGNV